MPWNSGWFSLDLREACNNQGRVNAVTRSGGLLSYPPAGYPDEQLAPPGSWLETDKVPFILVDPEGNCDNIDTSGQILRVPGLAVARCWLLGATEGAGSFEGELAFQTARQTHRCRFGLTSWSALEPHFDDALAVRCSLVRMDNRDVPGYPTSLWYTSRLVPVQEPILEIALPDLPGLHIFAITLQLQRKESDCEGVESTG